MKKIAVLLNSTIKNDSRVIKTIRTLSKTARVDLFYINGHDEDQKLFNQNVQLFTTKRPNNIKIKIIQHSCFYNEFLFFIQEVLQQNTQYDYVWANDLPCLKPAVKIKEKINCQLIYDSHEIFIGTLNQFFPDKTSVLKSIAFKIILRLMTFLGNWFEKRNIKKVDKFITTSISFKEYFEKKFKRKDIHIVMNCPESTIETESYNWRTEFPINKDDIIFIFQGNLNKGRALLELLESMKYVQTNIKLIILGGGTLKSELIKKTKNDHLENKVFFKDTVPITELLKYTRGADVGINLQSSINISKHLASANKLFEYTHATIPIIASDVPENRRIITKYNLGILTKNIPQEIANAINSIVNEDLQLYKMNCQKAALEYNWENQEKVILDIIS